MIDIFAIMNVLGRYHDLIQHETQALPEAEQMWAELQACANRHQKIINDIPEAVQFYNELKAIVDKHQKLIDYEIVATPAIQQLIGELLPILQQGSQTS